MTDDRYFAVIQARMGSSRLPGKMLRQLAGRPVVDYALERLCSDCKPKGMLDAVVLATSTQTDNDPLVAHVSEHWPDVIIVRGDEEDVLSRFISAVDTTNATVIIRATGDCPLINIEAMHGMLDGLRETGSDIVNYEPGYEYVDKGLEVVSAAALLRLVQDPELNEQDREHVTSLMYRRPERYQVKYIKSSPLLRRGDMRLTIDTEEDLRFFESLFQAIPGEISKKTLTEVVTFLEHHPQITAINACSGRKSTRHERARLGFRCDGNSEIGLGHVVGSLRLAKLLTRELGIGVEFLTRNNPAALSLIKNAGFALEVLPENTSPQQDMARIVQKADESDWSGVVTNFCKDDLEQYTSYFSAVKEARLPLIFMDNPLPPSHLLGSLLINALPHPNYEGYDPATLNRCLDGLEYFFAGTDEPPPERLTKTAVTRVLVAMGGGDSTNLTSRVIRGLSGAGFTGYVDIVLGKAFQHPEAVHRTFAESSLNGDIHINVSDLAQRMQLADLGFTALGLTTYEMAYYRLPTIILTANALNTEVAEQFARNYGTSEFIGNEKHIYIDDISRTFSALADNVNRRQTMSDSGISIGKHICEIPQQVWAVLRERRVR